MILARNINRYSVFFFSFSATNTQTHIQTNGTKTTPALYSMLYMQPGGPNVTM